MMEENINKKTIYYCELPTTFNMNITKKLVENLSNTYKSWQKSIDDEKDDNCENLIHDESSL